MSVVLCYADKSKAIMASDGRVIDINGNIIDEDYQKFYRATSTTIIGYAGNYNACESVITLLRQNNDFVSKLSFHSIFGFIVDYCKTFPDGIFYGFIMCGIDNGKIIYGQIDAKAGSMMKYVVGADVVCNGLYPQEIPQSSNLFGEILGARVDNGEPQEKAIKDTILYCSSRSHSVNDHIFLDKLQLHD